MTDKESKIHKHIERLKLQFGSAPVDDLVDMLNFQAMLEKKWSVERIILGLTPEEKEEFDADCQHRNMLAEKVNPSVSLYLLTMLDLPVN